MSKRPERQLPYDLVLIEWVDSARMPGSWLGLDEIEEAAPHKCLSVGFLVKEGPEAKILMPTTADIENAENYHFYGGIKIPTRSILSERKLR